ncbi:putative NADP-dependent mannitol dehydrogenase [Violaceomyces palustris]|uniref:NADP-dependent mannitol dehydrogenase n=1 Tax=Violaceomyces palustris TaxID=1673888 RepID=A0ACD0P2R6_9BASI|nr:putative NADP-dependent mannitol dehydrogenase [Violaceomyces palustris]
MFSIDFSQKTGGNRGIGYAISNAIAKAGGNLAIFYRSSTNAEKVAAEFASKYSIQCKAYQCDVSVMKQVRETVAKVVEEMGPISGLVANAGVATVKPALEIEDREEFDFMFGTNVLGVFNTAQTVARHWVDTGFKQGSIVIISSMSSQIYNQVGLNNPLCHVFYNSSKAAVSSLGKNLAAEWSQYGIRVNIVSPGYVKTEQSGVHSEEARAFQAASVPLQRYSEPDEQTSQVLLLLSEFSSYQTGSEVFIDGGCLIY